MAWSTKGHRSLLSYYPTSTGAEWFDYVNLFWGVGRLRLFEEHHYSLGYHRWQSLSSPPFSTFSQPTLFEWVDRSKSVQRWLVVVAAKWSQPLPFELSAFPVELHWVWLEASLDTLRGNCPPCLDKRKPRKALTYFQFYWGLGPRFISESRCYVW